MTNTSWGGGTNSSRPRRHGKTERRNHRSGCGGDACVLGWGVVGPQAMVWAEAADRHGQRKT